ncbi:M23 family metallopeptidase [Mechercharimyces sp. CAU 1602]|uniref:M23 family metallopeptidase n=1 Tax=Mechercharimyces sp. CAU 1602 TaxID=2973933 RepID=UPI002161148B|nr:M23 family metallopeptidase [Mechercharimyces sp. CAU 1602]MCS1352320.1 M23 family metallopeptidase [Mechercharimyces sp. CAU 1602]
MTNKKALLASSLSLCTVTWVTGNSSTALAMDTDEFLPPERMDTKEEKVAQQALVQYLNPIASVDEDHLATPVLDEVVYRVKGGDTLYGIGRKYGTTPKEIALHNGITNDWAIYPGQKIKMPYQVKRVRVQEKDTIKSLAKKYKTSPSLLRVLNEKEDLELLYVGQVIRVPSKEKIKKEKVALATSKSKAKVDATSGFIWPVKGQITSRFGWRGGAMHKGMDITNANKSANVIVSAKAGEVTRAGYSGGYGNLVVVDHGGGWVTYYAHLSKLIVSKGQRLGRGEALGYMGTTGDSTGVHLHLEVRKHDNPIDPLSVLP